VSKYINKKIISSEKKPVWIITYLRIGLMPSVHSYCIN
jgi:hypothetical protein